MHLLITGGSGMVGKNLSEKLNLSKNTILIPSSKELNLLDIFKIREYLSSNKIDMIIHCAGLVGGIQANIKKPVDFFNQNLLMGVNLVNACFECGIKNLINLGSSCMYPKDYVNPLKEEYILSAPLEQTNEGYGIAKITVAKLCEYYTKQYNVSYKTLIPCNLYGKYDKFNENYSHMIPSLIYKIDYAITHDIKDVTIWGDGTARREFMYMEDCVDAIIFAINNFERLDLYTNVGLGYDYSIKTYYEVISNVLGFQGNFKYDLTKPTGMKQKLVDTSKLTNLGWKAKFSLEHGIRKTYEYYKLTKLGDKK